MKKTEIFDQQRQERELYYTAEIETEVKIPLTRDGFNALLECATAVHQLPVDDLTTEVLAKYLNHVSNTSTTTTIKDLADRLYRSVSHALTWVIDQEQKEKFQKEQAKLREEAHLASINGAQKPLEVVGPVEAH